MAERMIRIPNGKMGEWVINSLGHFLNMLMQMPEQVYL